MSARFAVGDQVRIALRDPGCHHRTPHYLQGKTGTIERLLRPEGQPELLAYGGDGEPFQTVYRVRVAQDVLWADYAEGPQDCLEVEIFEHWLEPA